MVDDKEWQGFRADWIILLVGVGIVSFGLLLLGLIGMINAPGFDSGADGVASPVSCDGQLPDCAANVPRSVK